MCSSAPNVCSIMPVQLEPLFASRPIGRQAAAVLHVETDKRSFVDLTPSVRAWLEDIGAGTGGVTLFCRHTSASLVVQENADPRVQADLADAWDRLAPAEAPWRHDDEGPDDMPAHVKTSLTGSGLTIPVGDGRALLGTWQAVYLVEHRHRPHRREVRLQYLGD